MSIPNEAIEAAAKERVGEYAWLDAEDSHRTDYVRKARAVLESERHELDALLLDNINWADGDTGSAVDAILTHYTKKPAP